MQQKITVALLICHQEKRPKSFNGGLKIIQLKDIIRRWLYSHASIAVAFSDLIIMNMLIAGTQGT